METRQQVIRIHARVTDAIEAGNAQLAERSMRDHITATNARPLALATSSIPLAEEEPPAKPRALRAPRSVKK